MNNSNIHELIRDYLDGTLEPAAWEKLKTYLSLPENQETLREQLDQELLLQEYEKADPAILQRILGNVKTRDVNLVPSDKTYHRVHFLRRSWFRYAAAILLILGTGAYLFTTVNAPEYPAKNNQRVLQDVQAPLGNQATITLADGRKINLGDAAGGELARQDETTLKKTNDGQIIYSGTSSRPVFNTLTNPRGSKVVVMTLADGSKVWLNSESTITYPASFTGASRTVEMSGEAYFEIAKDASRPFFVRHKDVEVQVLGTHFNINTYPDQGANAVTLIEGSVAVKKNNDVRKINPGQQARIDQQVNILNDVNVGEVMAWKNGVFQFNDASIETIMKQVARWYDAEVVYEAKVDGNFVARISRDMPVSKLLQILELTDRVHFEIQGRRIIVKP